MREIVMANRPRRDAEIVSDALEENDTDQEQTDLTDMISSEMDAGEKDVHYKINVSRVTGPSRLGSSDAYLFSIDPTEAPTLRDRLRDQYGTGLYRVRLLKNGKFFKRWDVAVERPTGPVPVPVPVSVSQPGSDPLERVLQVITQQQAQLMAYLEGRSSQPQTPAIDPLTMMEKMVTIFTGMQAGRAGAAGSVSEVMEAVNKGIELAGRVNPQAEARETGLMDILKSIIESPALAEVVPKLLEGVKNAQQQPAPLQLPRPTGAPVAIPQLSPRTTPAPRPDAPDHIQALDNELRSLITELIKKAERKADPSLYAEWTLDNISEPIAEMIVKIPNLLDQLAIEFPAINTHRQWFDQLRGEVIRMVNEGPLDEPEHASHGVG